MIIYPEHIFVSQPWRVRLELDPRADGMGITAAELAQATSTKIQYQKPASSAWVDLTATQEASSTIIYADIPSAVNDTIGIWKFRALCTFTGDAGTVPGVTAEQVIDAR